MTVLSGDFATQKLPRLHMGVFSSSKYVNGTTKKTYSLVNVFKKRRVFLVFSVQDVFENRPIESITFINEWAKYNST